MAPVNNIVGCKNNGRRRRFLESSMQSQALEVMGVCDSCENNVRYSSVNKVEVCEVFDCGRLKCRVPGVVTGEIGSKDKVAQSTLVLIKDTAYFTHVSESVVVFRSKSEFFEISKLRYSLSVEVPSSKGSVRPTSVHLENERTRARDHVDGGVSREVLGLHLLAFRGNQSIQNLGEL